MLVLFAILLLYHFFSLRRDTNTRRSVGEKQEQFSVLVFDKGDEKFGEAVKLHSKVRAKLTINNQCK
jgi:hypothetical protein